MVVVMVMTTTTTTTTTTTIGNSHVMIGRDQWYYSHGKSTTNTSIMLDDTKTDEGRDRIPMAVIQLRGRGKRRRRRKRREKEEEEGVSRAAERRR